jgi:diguanylate cyclase (GGDEF)-like protein
MVVRYGGDEFLIVMPERGREITVVKQRIKKAVARWNEVNEIFDFSVTLSIGGSYWSPRGSESLEEVLAKADRQMYEEKEGSKRSVEPNDLRTDEKDRKLKQKRKTKAPI